MPKLFLIRFRQYHDPSYILYVTRNNRRDIPLSSDRSRWTSWFSATTRMTEASHLDKLEADWFFSLWANVDEYTFSRWSVEAIPIQAPGVHEQADRPSEHSHALRGGEYSP